MVDVLAVIEGPTQCTLAVVVQHVGELCMITRVALVEDSIEEVVCLRTECFSSLLAHLIVRIII